MPLGLAPKPEITLPRSGQRIAENLAALLAKRLIQANAKVDVLSAY